MTISSTLTNTHITRTAHYTAHSDGSSNSKQGGQLEGCPEAGLLEHTQGNKQLIIQNNQSYKQETAKKKAILQTNTEQKKKLTYN